MSALAETAHPEIHENPAETVTVNTDKWFNVALATGASFASYYLLRYSAATLPASLATMQPLPLALSVGSGIAGAALGYIGARLGGEGERTINLASAAASVITPIFAPAWYPVAQLIHNGSMLAGLRNFLR